MKRLVFALVAVAVTTVGTVFCAEFVGSHFSHLSGIDFSLEDRGFVDLFIRLPANRPCVQLDDSPIYQIVDGKIRKVETVCIEVTR